jgi:AraC-like DNA-binding protein
MSKTCLSQKQFNYFPLREYFMDKSNINQVKNQPSPASRHKAQEIKILLDSSPDQIPTLSFLEEKFNLGKNYLQNGFKELFGTTIGSYSKELKLKRIKNLLKDYTLTLDTIAINTGYNGGEALCRFFKMMEGITPGEWRKNWMDGHQFLEK